MPARNNRPRGCLDGLPRRPRLGCSKELISPFRWARVWPSWGPPGSGQDPTASSFWLAECPERAPLPRWHSCFQLWTCRLAGMLLLSAAVHQLLDASVIENVAFWPHGPMRPIRTSLGGAGGGLSFDEFCQRTSTDSIPHWRKWTAVVLANVAAGAWLVRFIGFRVSPAGMKATSALDNRSGRVM